MENTERSAKRRKLRTECDVSSGADVPAAAPPRRTVALLLGGTVGAEHLPRLSRYFHTRELGYEMVRLAREIRARDVDVVGCRLRSDDIPKAAAVASIESFFAQPATDFILYWWGHGQRGTGNWKMSDRRVMSLRDILQLWTESDRSRGRNDSRRLLIVSDCCFSGHWAARLEAMRDRERLPVAVQAASSTRELSFNDRKGPRLMQKMLADFPRLSLGSSGERPAAARAGSERSLRWPFRFQHPCFAVGGHWAATDVRTLRSGERRYRFGPWRLTDLTAHRHPRPTTIVAFHLRQTMLGWRHFRTFRARYRSYSLRRRKHDAK